MASTLEQSNAPDKEGRSLETVKKAGSDPGVFAPLSSSANGSAEWPPDDRLQRTIQYAAASRLNR
jgi:hypothetical protein